MQLAPPGAADTAGFVPAAGGAGSEEAAADATCSGAINRGDEIGCTRQSIEESYWTTTAGDAR